MTVWSRGPKLVFASLLAGGVLLASGTVALAWIAPEGKASCDSKQVAVTLKDVDGDYATSDTLVFTGPSGSFEKQYTWTQDKNTSQTFTYPLSDFAPGSYSVHPAADDSASATGYFTVEKCATPPTTTASSPRTNSPPPSGGGQGASTPGLPATGFAPDN